MPSPAGPDAREIRLLVFDVDGVLTDGRLYFLPDGTELDPDWALQVPEDYREVLRVAVPAAVAAAIEPHVKAWFFNVPGGGLLTELASQIVQWHRGVVLRGRDDLMSSAEALARRSATATPDNMAFSSREVRKTGLGRLNATTERLICPGSFAAGVLTAAFRLPTTRGLVCPFEAE